MGQTTKNDTCNIVCWVAAALIGLVVFIMTKGAMSVLLALILGVVVAVILALLFKRWFCSAVEAPVQTSAAPKPAAPAAPAAPKPAAPAAAAPAVAPAPVEAPKAAAPKVEAAPVAPVAEEKPEPKPAAAPVAEVADNDEAGSAPATLDGPRDGGADDLKKIKGVGPKLEILLNGMGFYHFDQIAGWSAGEIAWVNDNLAGFKGRVSRDNWVEQAGLLASGADTEFSKRVDDGNVY